MSMELWVRSVNASTQNQVLKRGINVPPPNQSILWVFIQDYCVILVIHLLFERPITYLMFTSGLFLCT